MGQPLGFTFPALVYMCIATPGAVESGAVESGVYLPIFSLHFLFHPVRLMCRNVANSFWTESEDIETETWAVNTEEFKVTF